VCERLGLSSSVAGAKALARPSTGLFAHHEQEIGSLESIVGSRLLALMVLSSRRVDFGGHLVLGDAALVSCTDFVSFDRHVRSQMQLGPLRSVDGMRQVWETSLVGSWFDLDLPLAMAQR
jgi:hypothetical protein